MQNIILKKKSVTKTNNLSFNILIKNANKPPLGSYNQNTGILLLDLDSFIIAISRGLNFSNSFKKILLTTAGNFINKKNLKIKF